MSEKTEKATPYKLQKAREKGRVSKSIELNTCISLLLLLSMISALWPKHLHELQIMLKQLLQHAANVHCTTDTMSFMCQLVLSKLLSLWLPLAVTGCLGIILTSIAQTGLVWSSTAITPDFKRLNPIAGFKKIYSIKTCFDAVKTLLKITLVSLVLYFVLHKQLLSLVQLMQQKPAQLPEFMMGFLLTLLFKLLIALSALAIADNFFSRWKFNKDNKMSKQEVKDEHKQKEGDPKIKSKIKQLQAQLRQKTAALKQVASADLIVTNPTHLAIALKYDRHSMPAPKVLCKAQDKMVIEVKAIARKHGIPIIEHKVFARLLYQTTELNQYIAKELFPVAADIFRTLYQQRSEHND